MPVSLSSLARWRASVGRVRVVHDHDHIRAGATRADDHGVARVLTCFSVVRPPYTPVCSWPR